MKNYGILGYGVEYEKIEKYLNRSKLIDIVYNWELTEDEGTDMTNIELLEKTIDDKDTILSYTRADDKEGYILIWYVAPWEMYHEDYKQLKTEKDAQEYIWEHLEEFLNSNLTKEEFIKMLYHISDSDSY